MVHRCAVDPDCPLDEICLRGLGRCAEARGRAGDECRQASDCEEDLVCRESVCSAEPIADAALEPDAARCGEGERRCAGSGLGAEVCREGAFVFVEVCDRCRDGICLPEPDAVVAPEIGVQPEAGGGAPPDVPMPEAGPVDVGIPRGCKDRFEEGFPLCGPGGAYLVHFLTPEVAALGETSRLAVELPCGAWPHEIRAGDALVSPGAPGAVLWVERIQGFGATCRYAGRPVELLSAVWPFEVATPAEGLGLTEPLAPGGGLQMIRVEQRLPSVLPLDEIALIEDETASLSLGPTTLTQDIRLFVDVPAPGFLGIPDYADLRVDYRYALETGLAASLQGEFEPELPSVTILGDGGLLPAPTTVIPLGPLWVQASLSLDLVPRVRAHGELGLSLAATVAGGRTVRFRWDRHADDGGHFTSAPLPGAEAGADLVPEPFAAAGLEVDVELVPRLELLLCSLAGLTLDVGPVMRASVAVDLVQGTLDYALRLFIRLAAGARFEFLGFEAETELASVELLVAEREGGTCVDQCPPDEPDRCDADDLLTCGQVDRDECLDRIVERCDDGCDAAAGACRVPDLPDPCAGLDCGPCARCDRRTGACDDRLPERTPCAGGWCREGDCVDPCDGLVCPPCEICNPAAGECVIDRGAAGRPCPGGICRDGACIDRCAGISCEPCQACDPDTGACAADADLDGSACPGGTCQGGICRNPCAGLDCGACRVCDGAGGCVAIADGLSCGANGVCLDGACEPIGCAVGCEPCLDEDGDGAGEGCPAGPDCNDGDRERHPGAVERCDGVDDDCDGEVDEGFRVGEVCTAGTGRCRAQGTTRCVAGGASACDAQPGAPAAESCNGQDDDCDGQTDEGNPDGGAACDTGGSGECGAGLLQCSGGRLVCRGAAAQEEICNGVDDDCDGGVDEGDDGQPLSESCYEGPPGTLGLGACQPGIRTCQNGSYGACAGELRPQAEVCDGQDNDCDGLADEGTLNACGSCGDPPPEDCNGVDDDCDGQIDEGVVNACGRCGPAPAELCDGVDNDCDGATDEGVTNPCGRCGPAPAEVCDGADNDCDGLTDEGLLNACGQCGPTPAEICDGNDNDCDGQTDEGVTNRCGRCGPLPAEICDGADNDCDGRVDANDGDMTPCPPGAECVAGGCADIAACEKMLRFPSLEAIDANRDYSGTDRCTQRDGPNQICIENDTWDNAVYMGQGGDRSNNANIGIYGGTFPDEGDEEDWWYMHVADQNIGFIQPEIALSWPGAPVGADIDLVVEYHCGTSLLNFDDVGGNCERAQGDADFIRCISNGPTSSESVEFEPDCVGGDDSGTLYIQVIRYRGTSCDMYRVTGCLGQGC